MPRPTNFRRRFLIRKPKITKPGVVEKIIKPVYPEEPEKAQIAIEDAEHLYREIRIDNELRDEDGHKRKLKEHAKVEVVVEADREATLPKSDSRSE